MSGVQAAICRLVEERKKAHADLASAQAEIARLTAERDEAARVGKETAAHLAEMLADEIAHADALAEAADALIVFHNAPVEAKRPDIFQMLMSRLNAALAAHNARRNG